MNDNKNNQSILNFNHDEAKEFFLKHESYCDLKFPPYIVFDKLINKISTTLNKKCFKDNQYREKKPKSREINNVNYTLFMNKDGKLSWRPIQLIHPVLYVSLVHQLTKKENWKTIQESFRRFSENKKIKCASIPVQSLSNKKDKAEQILNWWNEVEQLSIELSMEYNCFIESDISNCYGSIYTHSIAWALHGKENVKPKDGNINKLLIGNIIDFHIQDMSYGQTNGIPQGSVVMDFIAEMVLGYADSELSKKLNEKNITNYQIIRYRDDYRIFTNSLGEGEAILKEISDILSGLGLSLNSLKTKNNNRIIPSAIKGDKISWIKIENTRTSLQKYALLIHIHSAEYPNSGSVIKALIRLFKKIKNKKFTEEKSIPLIAIVTDIACKNPKMYPECFAIISHLISTFQEDKKIAIIEKIDNKFSNIANTGYMSVWLQRLTIPIANTAFKYQEKICNVVNGDVHSLWNNDWIKECEIKEILNTESIIDQEIISTLSPKFDSSEIETFPDNYG